MSRIRKPKLTPPPPNPRQALDLLAQAVSYCAAAGLTVKGGNDHGDMVLVFPDVQTQRDSQGAPRFILKKDLLGLAIDQVAEKLN